MHMICSSMPIPASTKLTEFSYISCRKNSALFLLGPGAYDPSVPYTQLLLSIKQKTLNWLSVFIHTVDVHCWELKPVA